MIFDWLKKRRRRRILAEPFPPAWEDLLAQNLSAYQWLSDEERARLRDRVKVFAAERRFEGCGGLEVTEEMRAVIAANACLIALNLEKAFQAVKTILVYPAEFRVRDSEAAIAEDGVIYEDDESRLGEAWYRGPVVISWADVPRKGCRPEGGVNVVFHEFAHQLDMEDGVVDGTPVIADPEVRRRWREVMTAEYDKLAAASAKGRATLLDEYGAQDPGEFFAVATECFFERPTAFAARHGELYRLLAAYFRQDPAARVRGRKARLRS